MENNQQQFISLSPEQKIGFVLLLIFGILAIALGFLQMRNTIYNPFVIRFQDESNAQVFADEKTHLQQIDTDQDGISDYDELEFYKTSPYLPDTDSDGLSDKFEIDNNKDPLCPEGELCETQTVPQTTKETKTELPISEQPSAADILNQAGQIGDTANVDLSGVVSDPALIRQLLLSTGKITEEQLSKVDDATLMELVKNMQLPNTAGGN